MGQCKLCLRDAILRNSHVFPELVYRPVYDPDSRCLRLDSATGKSRVAQSGRYEPMLCDNCEAVFQRAENYFAKHWFQLDPLPDPVDSVYVERAGFDFEQYFRFHLSILWRASVARDPMFAAVKLGPFEDPLRRFLLGIDETLRYEPRVYAMVLRQPRTHELWNRIVVAPVRSRIYGITTYVSAFGGCSWHYCVSKQGGPLPESLQLKRPGSIIMPVIDYTDEGSIITQAWEAWKKSSRSAMPPDATAQPRSRSATGY